MSCSIWYDHGIRMFKFDFVDLNAATPGTAATLSKAEIKERNATAFRDALRTFRQKNPEAVLIAFNGFGGDLDNTFTRLPFHDPTDLRWLEVFQMEYTGDPRPSDVPEANFWRSMDIYSDHMVRRFEQLGFPAGADRLDWFHGRQYRHHLLPRHACVERRISADDGSRRMGKHRSR